MSRLGVLGGTFDPIHIAHLVAASCARHALDLDRVLFVVAGEPWQKEGRVAAPADDRFGMVAAALEGVDGFEASRLELDRDGPTYTADTLEQLAAAEPDAELFLVLGADAAANLPTWERVEVVQRLATLAVVNRDGDPVVSPGVGWRMEVVEMPRLDISSHELRARIADGRPVDWLVPPGAVRWIREHGLYAGGR